MDRDKRRLGQLKFIASMFQLVMKELDNVMGPESIRTIFRLIGERQGEEIEKRMKDKFRVDDWTPEKFAEKLIQDVFDPALGEGQAEIKIEGEDLIISLGVCPFKRAGIDTSNKFYCTYTEGLIETVADKALGGVTFKSEDLISEGKPCCTFKLKLT
jgi:predicted ArsR family transcriptional regulator